MNRSRLVLLSHCILNPRVRAGDDEIREAVQPILEVLLRTDVLIEQLPCPEFLFLGRRDKRTKDAWEALEGFAEHCARLAEETGHRLRGVPVNSYPLLMMSVSRSPCCSSSLVYRDRGLVSEPGIFVNELSSRLSLQFVEFDFRDPASSARRMGLFLKERCGP